MPITYTHLLRMEGVNLYGFVLDTQKLSAIRGGGLMLLAAVAAAQKAAEAAAETANGSITAISTGASSGVFGLTVSSDDNAITVANAVVAALAVGIYAHATFVVDVIAQGTGERASFRHDIEAVIAANRARQYRMPALQVPADGQWPCAINRILPAAQNDEHSSSVAERLDYGKKSKQDFYEAQLGLLDIGTEDIKTRLDKDFAQDFDKIAALGDLADHLPESINNKIAVFYADGNKFGTIGAGAATADALHAWDEYIKTRRRKLLRDLLGDMQKNHRRTGSKTFQFETLLWGGDELMFVMPAWAGLAFAQRFFEITAIWTHGAERLTHCAGLAFCHHDSPIHAIADLVRGLADSAKANTPKNTNALQYVVLESFDHTGEDWAEFLKRVYLGKLEVKDRIIEIPFTEPTTPATPDALGALINSIKHVTKVLPRSRLTPWIHHLLSDDTYCSTKSTAAFARLTHDLSEISMSAFPWNAQNIAAWAHVAELWDYAVDVEALDARLTVPAAPAPASTQTQT